MSFILRTAVRSYGTIHLATRIVSTAKPILVIPEAGYTFPQAHAAAALPVKTRLREARENRLAARQQQSRRIKLVTGEDMELPEERISRMRLQPKAEEKLEVQAQIRKARTQERIFNHLQAIVMSKIALGQAGQYLRLTRVIPSYDMRSYTVYWCVDFEGKEEQLREKLDPLLAKNEPAVRYHLGLALGSKFTPAIKFRYEDYTSASVRCVEHVDTADTH